MAKPTITESDLCRNAKRCGTSTAEIETFLDVETKGRGFDSADRPIILFERHWFHKLTKGKYDASHPDISNSKPGGYGSSASQYNRFTEAYALDPQAAMKSASWGLGQVMGYNYALAGYESVDAFVDAMKESEGKQLDAAIEFVLHNHLDDELRNHNWAGFAKGYNGGNYRINNYDQKLATAFAKFSKRKINCNGLKDSASQTATQIDPPLDSNVELQQPAVNETPNEQPTVTQETTATSSSIVTTTETKGDPPDAPPTQVSKNGALSKWLVGSGVVTTVGGAIWQWMTTNANYIGLAIVCVTVLIALYMFRGIVTDAIRMLVAADPDKKNVT